ncbi:autotransporter domain-containing protein [Prochlorococcus sp. MIT 0702]|uniref:autotransporter domain-containing protein n=1 Tax=Prochlorococcus sp. MIT 0702 TaxID=1499503 RepID=UPI0039A4CD92
MSYPVNRVKIYSDVSTQGSVRTIENLGEDWAAGESLYDTIIYNDISSAGDVALWFKDGFQGGSDGRVSIVIQDGVSIKGAGSNGVIQFKSGNSLNFTNKASLTIGQGSVVKSTDGPALKLSNSPPLTGVDLELVMDAGSKLIGGGASPIAIGMTNGIAHKLDLTLNTGAEIIGDIVIGLNAEGHIALNTDAEITGDIQMNNLKDTLENDGTITGAIDMGAGGDVVINNGTINGAITMGAGKDFLDNGLDKGSAAIIKGDIDMGAGNDVLTNSAGSATTGAIAMGDGNDDIVNSNGSTITGAIIMGAGENEVDNYYGSTINGPITMGDGNDDLDNGYHYRAVDVWSGDDGSMIKGDIDMGAGVNRLFNGNGSTITGNIVMGDGNDALTNDHSIIAGNIDMGDGADVLGNGIYTEEGFATIDGDIDMGAGDDKLYNGSSLPINGKITGNIDMGAGNDVLTNHEASIITAKTIQMQGGADILKNSGTITSTSIKMAGGKDELTNYIDGMITSKSIHMGNGDDVFINKGTLNVDSISLGSGSDVIYVDSPINARTDGGTVTIDGGSDEEDITNDLNIDVVRFGASAGTGTIDGSNYINFYKAVQEGGTWNYDKDFSHIPQFVVEGGVMDATDKKPATFNDLTLQGGQIQTDIHDHSGDSYPAPIKVKGSFVYDDGSLVINAEQMTNPTGSFNIIDIKGSETEIAELADNTYLQYGDPASTCYSPEETDTCSFNGLGKENKLESSVREAYLEKGSLLLVVEKKTKDDIKEDLTPDNPGGGSSSGDDSIDELLPGCDDDEDLCDIIADHPDDDDAADEDEAIAEDIVDEILLPIIDSDGDSDDDVALPLLDYGQLARLVVSGLMPRNVDGPGQSMSTYNNLLVDTVFERLPLRQFQVVEQAIEQATFVEEEPVEEIQPQEAEPVRGLWMKSAAVDEQQALDYLEQETSQITVAQASGSESASVDGQTVITIDDIDYVDLDSLTADYSERDGMRAWFRGFGGSSSFSKSSTVYNGYDISNGGGVVGVDVSLAKNIQLGAYANYGQINLSQNSSDAGGGSWNPSGWGGGITADWWTDNFYVQGLLGGTGFSGDQKRDIVAIVDGWGSSTATGDKSSTSYVGAVRLGAPFDLGSVLLEPQFSAVWTRNDENSFSESSAHSRLNLKYHSRTTNYFQTDLGVKLAYPIKSGDRGLVVPSLKVAWLRDWDQNNEAQKIGYTFTDRTISVDSNQDSQDGLLLEAGVDYTINNFGTTSFKVYGRGGLEFWDTSNRGTDWRASGGVTFQF